MSLFDPSTSFLAFPPPPDVPINQPAFGDNIAWNSQGGQDYDHWTNFEGAYDESWAWDGRKETLWSDYVPESKSVLISVRPSTASGPGASESEPNSRRRRSKSARPSPVADSHDSSTEKWDNVAHDYQQAGLDWLAPDFQNFQPDFAASNDVSALSDLMRWEPETTVAPGLSAADPFGDALAVDGGLLGSAPVDAEFLESSRTFGHMAQPSDAFAAEIHDFGAMIAQGPEDFPMDDQYDGAWSQNEREFLGLSEPAISRDPVPSDNDAAPFLTEEEPTSVLEIMKDVPESSSSDVFSPAYTSLESAQSPSSPGDQSLVVTCTTCQKIVKRRKLRDHMRWHIKNSQCEVCQKSFATDKDLRRHQKQHTGDKPFKCDVPGCKYTDTGFARLDNLRRHVKKIHGEAPS